MTSNAHLCCILFTSHEKSDKFRSVPVLQITEFGCYLLILDGTCREKLRQKDRGYDSDDEDLKRGLQKQDSLEFTRARLAKSRQDKKMTAIRQLAERDDVDVIIDENAKV